MSVLNRAFVKLMALAVACAAVTAGDAAEVAKGTATLPGGATVDFTYAETNWVKNAETGLNELVMIFSNTAATAKHSFTLKGQAKADLLVVGGGGAGASGGEVKPNRGAGGGGGAGGFLATNKMILASGVYSIAVGAGGARGADASGVDGEDGQPSTVTADNATFTPLTAHGGGGGGYQSDGHGNKEGVDRLYGSGGGGSKKWLSSTDWSAQVGGLGTPGQGNKGGDGKAATAAALGTTAGAGGGAGGPGEDTATKNVGTEGGAGVSSEITGKKVWYAAGGGGGTATATAAKIGKGGGDGTGGNTIGGNGASGLTSAPIAATDGKPGTGSGGGGGSFVQGGGAGGSGIVIVRISAAAAGPLVKPVSQEIAYDAKSHLLVEKSPFWSVWVNDAPVDKVEETDAGAYPATVKLVEGFTWSDGTDDEVDVTLTITAAVPQIVDLRLDSWVVGTAEPPRPSCTVTPSYLAAECTVDYTYGTDTNQPAAFVADVPVEKGSYWVRAEIAKEKNHEAAVAYAPFAIVADPAGSFRDFVEITIKPYVPAAGGATELTNYPYKVELAEHNPEGFAYFNEDGSWCAGPTGENLAFTTEAGAPLAYAVGTDSDGKSQWDTEGTSVVYVQLPRLGPAEQKIRLYWEPKPGEEVPPYVPENVWTTEWPTPASTTTVTPPERDFGVVTRDGEKIDGWVDLPQMDMTTWGVTDDPSKTGTVLTNGSLTSRRPVTYVITNAEKEEPPLTSMPTNAGLYLVTFKPVDETGYRPISHVLTVRVTERDPYYDLRGDAATQTLSGRVMLANADKKSGHEVGVDDEHGQAYWQVRTVKAGFFTYEYNPFWTHEEELLPETVEAYPHILEGSKHRLNYLDANNVTNVIWRFDNVGVGNAYNSGGTMEFGKCYLPNSSTALGISAYSKRNTTGDVTESGHMGLLNEVGASVSSMCYTNGIGTIYFDAVNEWVDGAADGGYKLVVEIATEVVGDGGQLLPPTDANAGEELEKILSWEEGKPSEGRWRPVEMIPLKRDKGETAFTRLPPTKELALDIQGDMSVDNFYRVCVPVNIEGSVRFRIRRTSVAAVDHFNALILLDNILVSYPKNDAAIETYGRYDGPVSAREVGRKELGWKAATSVAFPTVGDSDVYARADATLYPNAISADKAKDFIQLVRLHYRWRNLEVTNAWQTLDLTQREKPAELGGGIDFVANAPLVGLDREGDVEYWYETYLKLPFYDYVDYSGTGVGLGGCFTEEKSIDTNRVSKAQYGKGLASLGEDWFFRLRPAHSDFETLRLYVKTSEGGAVETNDMWLAGDHTWRGTYQTGKKETKDLWVRFAMVNRQTPGATVYAENIETYRLENDVATLPKTVSLAPAGEDEWSHVVCDSLTGYLLFQVEDGSHGCTIVHADRQNFDAWDDANKKDGKGLFVGNLTETSGVSAVTREFPDEIAGWQETVATNKLWMEHFIVDSGAIAPGKGYPPWEPWSVPKKTPNGLRAGPGQWVTKNYRDTATGLALQMSRSGGGYLQFIDSETSPRGISSLEVSARIAQSIGFDDFSYYDGGEKLDMTNYTFWVRGAYDTVSRKSFAGNASLSLVAGYTAEYGGYELRVEQLDASTSSGALTPGNKHYLTIYRWKYDEATGRMVANSLKTATANNKSYFNTAKADGNYSAIFFSINVLPDKTELVGGVTYAQSVTTPAANQTTVWVKFEDKADRLVDELGQPVGGTYGVLAANCEGRFIKPYVGDALVYASASGKFAEPGHAMSCVNDMDRKWKVNRRRAKRYYSNANYFGLESVIEPQQLTVYKAPAGSDDWTEFLSTNITSFASQKVAFDIWSKDSCSIRVAPSGASELTDIVLEDFELRQWCGESYDEVRYFDTGMIGYGLPTNFVFTQAWNLTNGVTEGVRCELNARRAKNVNEAVSVRSPLMDGDPARGLGLGMFSFTYANAQTNVNLLLQIATNMNATVTGLPNLSRTVSETDWTTVTNYSFVGLSEKERASGSRAYYFGLHGVRGVMRLVLDPKLVQGVATNREPSAFGSIEITSVLCRDEPSLDKYAWWGWNLRTTDDLAMRSLDDNYVDGSKCGMTLGLNNSTDPVKGELRSESEYGEGAYKKHLPFVQTPTFAADVVGEVSFKARKYDRKDPDTQVVLFGARTGVATDDGWEKLRAFPVTSDSFVTYTHKTLAGDNFSAFRFVVTGVEPVDEPKMKDPEAPANPQRVLLDDVLVMEAIRAKVSFRNVAAFRSNLDGLEPVPNAMDSSEQPLCREAWGVQAEIYAAQLAEEVDLESAVVRLWWYEDDVPWGFDRWKDKAKAKKAWLVRCEGTDDYVFRSSYKGASDAVMPEQKTPKTVQYMLEVQYKNRDGSDGTAWLDVAAGEWQTPPWYAPLDRNADDGQGEHLSAYTILDTVSPGWAWLNEVNLFGTYTPNFDNTDVPYQFVEIAAPYDADLTDWTVRFLYPNLQTGAVSTNEVARFGANDRHSPPGLKKVQDRMDPSSKSVFHVLASPKAVNLDPAKGEVDGTWKVTQSTAAVKTDGEAQTSAPLSIQLVRPSGIVEHEIVTLSTNDWKSASYDPEAHVAFLNDHERGGRFFYAGMDNGGLVAGKDGSTSIGVHYGHGGTEMTLAEDVSHYWNSTNYMTPGAINGAQTIGAPAPRPLGSSIVIFSQIEGDHLTQTFGPAEATNGIVTLLFRKGDEHGTNIVYHVDRWFVLDTVTTNGRPVRVPAPVGRDYVVNVGKGASNDVTVVAKAALTNSLELTYGLTKDNPYTPAVIDWLLGGKTLYGEFGGPNKGKDEIGLAEYHGLDGNYVTNLDLTAMYWLDIDPTWNKGDLWLMGGTSDIDYGTVAPNVRMKVRLAVTNTSDLAKAGIGPGKRVWAPYVLRSKVPGVTSWDYASQTGAGAGNWDSVTFKPTGLLNNGLTDWSNRASWIPLRWFVFGASSFDANFETRIDLVDPTSTESAGFSAGWYRWIKEHPDVSVGFNFQWDIDDRRRPVSAEILQKTNDL